MSPAMHVMSKVWLEAPLAAMPIIKLVTEIMPSFAPSTDARSQPVRSIKCFSA